MSARTRGHRWIRLLLAVAGLSLTGLAGCQEGSGPTGPEPPTDPPPDPPTAGQLTVTVSGSGATAAAFVVTVTGAGITSPAAAGNATLYTRSTGSTLKAVVLGTPVSGALFSFSVPDVDLAASYSVTLSGLANSNNELLDPTKYTVSVVR